MLLGQSKLEKKNTLYFLSEDIVSTCVICLRQDDRYLKLGLVKQKMQKAGCHLFLRI
jgi:hypothetical protein